MVSSRVKSMGEVGTGKIMPKEKNAKFIERESELFVINSAQRAVCSLHVMRGAKQVINMFKLWVECVDIVRASKFKLSRSCATHGATFVRSAVG